MIDKSTKQEIAAHLTTFVCIQGSEVKAGKTIDVSNATVNKVVKGQWEGISDAMFRKIAHGVGYNMASHADTSTYLALDGIFNKSFQYQTCFAAASKEGSGKTYTLDKFRSQHKNVAYFKCHRHTTAKEMLLGIIKSLGNRQVRGQIAFLLEMLQNIVSKLDTPPVIIIDEIEKTRNDILYLTIDIYNVVEGKAGLVYLGTPYFITRINTGIEKQSMCFPEILSRMGGKIISIPAPTQADAKMVIEAHGISDINVIMDIINDSKNRYDEIDLRRVDRLVLAKTLKQAIEPAAA